MNVDFIDLDSDVGVVNAARVSFDKEHGAFATDQFVKTENAYFDFIHLDQMDRFDRLPFYRRWFAKKPYRFEKISSDERLLSYLAREKHHTPFCHPHCSFRITAPIFVARQLVKHQVGLSWSEMSRRYVSGPPSYWQPDEWRAKPVGSIKQGSGGALAGWKSSLADSIYRLALFVSDLAYDRLLALGVCPEQARAALPLATETTWVWTGSLLAWHRVCSLRLDEHAQAETRAVAERIDELCARRYPHAWAALVAESR